MVASLFSKPPRRAFLQGGGALLVGMTLGGRGRAESLGPFPRPDITGPSPDPKTVDSWIRVSADNRVTLLMGKCHIGQGNITAMTQIAAEELDVGMDQVSCAPQVSGITPDQGEVDSSSSIEFAGPEVRNAAAEARQALLALAAARLGAPVEALTVERGLVWVKGAPQRSVAYGELLAGKRMQVAVTGKAPLKRPADYRLVGRSEPRDDMAPKVAGRFAFMQSLKLPGMLHGRVVRPRGQGMYGTVPKVVSIDEASIAAIPGARLVRKGDFVGVVAPREWDAVKAARALKVEWKYAGGLSGSDRLYDRMRAAKTEDSVVETAGDAGAAFARAPHKVAASYRGPYQGHAPFAPHCAIADVRADGARVLSSNQGVYATRHAVSQVLPHLPLESIVAEHHEGSGVYGAACYQDVAQAAALMSLMVGAPVRVQFMRWDDHGWDNYGNAHVAEVKVAADEAGKIVAYQYDGWQHAWIFHEATEEFALGKTQPPSKPDLARVVNRLNAGVMYDLPNKQLNNHHISTLDGYLRANALRSPLDLAICFASEQAIDELAVALKLDPIEFRRRNMSKPRWIGVMDAAARAANWTPRAQGSARRSGSTLRGRGIGLGTHFSSHGCAVAEVEVDRATGAVRVQHVVGAIDAGLVVNPDIVESQIIGMCTQAASRMLKEEVAFDTEKVTSLDWVSYPVLRFDEHPRITPVIVQRTDQPSTGAGEEVMGATAAAIANAVFDATGVRFHQFPLTPARVLAGLKGA